MSLLDFQLAPERDPNVKCKDVCAFTLQTDIEAPIQSALFFESVEEIYRRLFCSLKPRADLVEATVRFRAYANANSRIRLENGRLTVLISDVLEGAPAPVHEALAVILLHKLFRKKPNQIANARYRRYLNRADVRSRLELLKQQRGRKIVLNPVGTHFNLYEVFDVINLRYFFGLMARPNLGWSVRPARTTLGHYDPSHNTIVLSSILDRPHAPPILIEYVMFHEMLHLKFPAEQRDARRCIHTPQFKEAEAKFEQFEPAKRALESYLNRLTLRSRSLALDSGRF